MKFTILSHAGLLVEHNDKRVVCDPWLLGSCYWRSWWNFPEPPRQLISDLSADYIYLTHLHWDHFHGASLKKLFDPEIHILVPKVPTRRMVTDLNYLGFHNVTEIPHGSSIQLADDFSLSSYQGGIAVDSAVILSSKNTTLFNANDCKVFGLPLKQITQRFPKIDFVFKSHSSATAIPYCIESYEETFSDLRTQSDYIEEFCRFALSIGARYAIPFASNHCFLHRETMQFNNMAVRPGDVKDRFQRVSSLMDMDSECVVMVPGSHWCENEGFQLEEFDFADSQSYIIALRKKYERKLNLQYKKEDETQANFESFNDYFNSFLKSIPWPIKKLLNPGIVFRTTDCDGQHNWLVDTRSKKVVTLPLNESEKYVVLETSPLILNDCTQIKMFSVWTASKRLKIYLPSASDLKRVQTLFSSLDLYELESLPLKQNFSFRSLNIRLRRWRDVIEALGLLLKHKILSRPFIIADLYPIKKQ